MLLPRLQGENSIKGASPRQGAQQENEVRTLFPPQETTSFPLSARADGGGDDYVMSCCLSYRRPYNPFLVYLVQPSTLLTL